MKRLSISVVAGLVLLLSAGTSLRAQQDNALIVTSSNAASNELLVYDTAGSLVEAVPTQGQGGAGGNAGGIATQKRAVAVVNFGSQSVSIFERGTLGFVLRQVVPTLSAPVSVAFGTDHLYVLGTATVESHRFDGQLIETDPDGAAALVRADGSAAQVGVLGNELLVTEKSGPVEVFTLRAGAVDGSATGVPLPAGAIQPFGFATRGNNAYVTFAVSDQIGLVKNGGVPSIVAIGSGTPGGPGQHAPCWIALAGAYAFTTNSPSHSLSRLVVTGNQVILDDPIAAQTNGAPRDIAADGNLIAVVEGDGSNQSHVTQFRIGDDGSLVQVATTAVAAPANGVAIVSEQ